jgi:hypothetical protein
MPVPQATLLLSAESRIDLDRRQAKKRQQYGRQRMGKRVCGETDPPIRILSGFAVLH